MRKFNWLAFLVTVFGSVVIITGMQYIPAKVFGITLYANARINPPPQIYIHPFVKFRTKCPHCQYPVVIFTKIKAIKVPCK